MIVEVKGDALNAAASPAAEETGAHPVVADPALIEPKPVIKKGRSGSMDTPVTFKELGHYDNILCDVLLDTMKLGFRTHKMGANIEGLDLVLAECVEDFQEQDYEKWFTEDRRLLSGFLLQVIRDLVLSKGNVKRGAEAVMKIFLDKTEVLFDGSEGKPPLTKVVVDVGAIEAARQVLKPYKTHLESLEEKNRNDFQNHIEKYLSMYHRNAGYEISRTYRYKSSNKVEACLISTKQWNKGDQMHFCAGALTALTPEEEDQLQDFSMIYSTKKKSTNLFLGPARFANHDCKPNVHFQILESDAICFRVIEDIQVGSEICVSYGENYFGENNKECLCYSCERLERNGFKKPDGPDNSRNLKMNYNLTKMFDAQKTSRKREIAKDECQICANKLTPSGATSAPATSETTSAISFNSSSGDCDVIDVENVVCQATPTVLRPIGAHYIPSKNKKKVSHFLTACARCFRHYELFAEKWPKRSPMAVLERSDILHEIAEEDEEEDEDEAAREEEIIKVCGKAVENVDVPRIAWVRPTDSSKIWWPALLVPHRYNELCKEFNAVLKKNATLEDDQVMCIFFECPSMALVSINDCYNFVPDDELYTYFMNMYNPNLAYTTQVVNAVAFMNAEVPQFAKWNNYRAVMKSIVENHSELYKKIDHSIPDSLEATTGVVSDSTKSQTILNPTALAYVCMKKAKDEKKNKRKRQTKRQQPSTPKEKKPVEPKPESEPYYDGPARLVLHKLEEDDSENPELTKSVYWLGIVLTKSVCEEIKRDAMKLANECKKGQVVVFYFEYPLFGICDENELEELGAHGIPDSTKYPDFDYKEDVAWNNLQCFLKHRTILKNPRFKGASLLYLPVIADSLKKENVIQTEGKIAEVEEQEEIVIEEDAVVVTQKKKPGRKRKQDETHAAGVEELVEKDEKEKRKPGRRRKDETNTPKKQFISNDENKPPKIFTRE